MHRRERRVPVRLLLVLGLLGLLGVRGTYAFWTDTASVDGTSLTAGTIDIQVDSADSITSTTLAMASMVPGSTAAQVISVKNSGTVPLTYSVTSGLTGVDAGAYASTSSLRLTVILGGTRSASGGNATCSGGTPLVSAVGLTSTPSTQVVPRRGPLAVDASESLCVQVGLDAAAPSSLQGKAASLSLSVVASSDLS